MKKVYLLLLLSATFFSGNAQIDWQRSEATSNLPSWAGTDNTERGMAYNPTNDHMYVVSRNGSTKIQVMNAADGTDIREIQRDVAVITGGTFFLNDVEVSTDGSILACNLTTDASTSAFKIYKYDNETATPTVYISYTAEALRLGDAFKVAGDISSNAVILAAGGGKVVRWIVTAGVLGEPSVITLPDTHGNTMVAYPATVDSNPDLYVNSNGQPIRKYNADGTSAGETLSIVGGSSNDFQYFTQDGQEYIAVFQYGSGEIGELATLVNVTGGLNTATTVSRTPKLGANGNGNGSGGVGVKTEGTNTINVYALGTNNGISGTTLIFNGTVLSNDEFSVSKTKIFPNPARDEFQISFENSTDPNAEVTIYDINGRVVKSTKLTSQSQSISIDDLSRGMYIVKVINGVNQTSSKLLKN